MSHYAHDSQDLKSFPESEQDQNSYSASRDSTPSRNQRTSQLLDYNPELPPAGPLARGKITVDSTPVPNSRRATQSRSTRLPGVKGRKWKDSPDKEPINFDMTTPPLYETSVYRDKYELFNMGDHIPRVDTKANHRSLDTGCEAPRPPSPTTGTTSTVGGIQVPKTKNVSNHDALKSQPQNEPQHKNTNLALPPLSSANVYYDGVKIECSQLDYDMFYSNLPNVSVHQSKQQRDAIKAARRKAAFEAAKNNRTQTTVSEMRERANYIGPTEAPEGMLAQHRRQNEKQARAHGSAGRGYGTSQSSTLIQSSDQDGYGAGEGDDVLETEPLQCFQSDQGVVYALPSEVGQSLQRGPEQTGKHGKVKQASNQGEKNAEDKSETAVTGVPTFASTLAAKEQQLKADSGIITEEYLGEKVVDGLTAQDFDDTTSKMIRYQHADGTIDHIITGVIGKDGGESEESAMQSFVDHSKVLLDASSGTIVTEYHGKQEIEEGFEMYGEYVYHATGKLIVFNHLLGRVDMVLSGILNVEDLKKSNKKTDTVVDTASAAEATVAKGAETEEAVGMPTPPDSNTTGSPNVEDGVTHAAPTKKRKAGDVNERVSKKQKQKQDEVSDCSEYASPTKKQTSKTVAGGVGQKRKSDDEATKDNAKRQKIDDDPDDDAPETPKHVSRKIKPATGVKGKTSNRAKAKKDLAEMSVTELIETEAPEEEEDQNIVIAQLKAKIAALKEAGGNANLDGVTVDAIAASEDVYGDSDDNEKKKPVRARPRKRATGTKRGGVAEKDDLLLTGEDETAVSSRQASKRSGANKTTKAGKKNTKQTAAKRTRVIDQDQDDNDDDDDDDAFKPGQRRKRVKQALVVNPL